MVAVLKVHYSLILAAHLAALFLRQTAVVNGADSGAAVAHISIGAGIFGMWCMPLRALLTQLGQNQSLY
jgi:hypothetical protein